VVAENKYCITVVSKKSVHRTVPQDWKKRSLFNRLLTKKFDC
jgi:hypothetical protein